MNGFNPLRHDCGSQGCFNLTRRPKIELFADCFPGKIAMADIDGIVEINGRFLFLEWKTPDAQLSTGGRITVANLSKIPGSIVLVVWGDAQTMVVENAEIWLGGRRVTPSCNGISDVKKWMANWAEISTKKQQLFACDVINGMWTFC